MESKLSQSAEILSNAGKFAVGNDLVFIPDFQHSLTDLFKRKVFTNNEISYCDQFTGDGSLLRYASTWAAKEAVYKAIKQLDPAPISFNKIEILREKIGGKPTVVLHRESLSHFNISLTLSHDGDYAWAIALIEIVAI